MEGLRLIPYVALVLTIAGVILGASVISLGTFGDSVTACVNSSYSQNTASGEGTTFSDSKCRNNTLGAIGTSGDGFNFTPEYNAIYQSTDGLSTVAEQQTTVAIIAVMTIIISIIAGVFVYMRYFR